MIQSQNYHWMKERWKMIKNHWQTMIWYLWNLIIKIDFLFFTTVYLFITLLYIVYFLLSSCCWWWDWWCITSFKLNQFHCVFVLFSIFWLIVFFFFFSKFFLFSKTQNYFMFYMTFLIKKCVIWKIGFWNSNQSCYF